jgi:hypothetical protein
MNEMIGEWSLTELKLEMTDRRQNWVVLALDDIASVVNVNAGRLELTQV